MLERLELEEAQALLARQTPLGAEVLPIDKALGRTAAAHVAAPFDQPPFDRSPLDGYALRAADSVGASPETPAKLRVLETVYAGGVPAQMVTPGTCVRVMTGSMLPAGADCVLRQEDTDMGYPEVAIRKALRPHENYVDRGEDFQTGTILLPAGARLDAAAIGVLASAGMGEVAVRRLPRVAVLTTGDEVAAPGAPLPPGKIYGANLPLLTARLTELGIPVAAADHVGDDPQRVAGQMASMLKDCDLLITTGGVSVGEKDIFHQALPLLGAEVVFWRIKAKPGTPAMFSRYEGKPIVSLSGNPFAAVATFELLARPALAALAGEPALLPARREATLETPFGKASPGRRFVRGRFENGGVTLPAGHSSGALASMMGCNCLVDIPAGSPALTAGDAVSILLL